MKTKLPFFIALLVIIAGISKSYSQTYCTPTFGYGAGSACGQTYPFHITTVLLGTLNATGMVANGCSGAGTFQLMSQTGNVTAGSTYTLSVSRYMAGYTVRATVYADWNHNGTLNDAGETLISGVSFGTTGTTLTQSVTVPVGAYIGTTRLRVIVKYNTAIGGPCVLGGALTQGETKDFNITILSSCTSPSTQVSGFALNAVTTGSCDIGWTRGSGDGGVIVVARQGAAPTADPISGTTYTADASYTGAGSAIGGGKVVYIGTGTNVNVTSLTAGQTYYFNIYEYNATGICFKTPALTGSVPIPTCLPPTAQSTSFTSGNILTTSADIGWTRAVSGGGDNVIVVARMGSAPNADPVNGVAYTADAGFGLGSVIGTGNFVVYAGSGTGVSITGLLPSSGYYFKIYEYYTSGYCYNTGGPLQGNFTSASCSPTIDATAYSGVSNPGGSNIDVSFTRGNGSRVLVVARQGSAVTTTGASIYNQDFSGISGIGTGTFGYGTGAAQIGTSGNYVVYEGTGNAVTVTGTTPGASYYFAVFEYNNSPNCYSASPLTGMTQAQNPMTFTSMTTAQVTGNVAPSAVNQQIIQIQVVTTGGTLPPITTNSITFNTNGTTLSSADIANVKIYYTGTSSTFATTTQFGSTVTGANIPSGATTYTVSGTQNLAVGTNYFWVAYDIGPYPGCTLGDYVDAECTAANLSSTYVGTLNPTPTVTAPAGSRQIQLTYCTPSPSFGGSSCGAAGNIYITTAKLSGTTFYSGGTCGANPYTNLTGSVTANVNSGQSYTLNLISADATALYVDDFYAWVDWNNNGLFTDAGENILAVTVASGGSLNVTGSSFIVPANPGLHRMRVAVMGGGFGSIPAIAPCAGQSGYYGEFKDFNVMVASATPMVYSSSTVTQNTASVSPNTTNQQVIGIQVVTTGSLSPLSLTQLDLNITGTTLASDITNAKVYYTGGSSTFATTTQFGSTVNAPTGSFIVSGNQTLAGGTDYFWLAYDVPATAIPGDLLDGVCSAITVGGTIYTPTVTAPTGSRTIMITGTNAPPGIPILYYDMELNTARGTLDLTPEQTMNANANITTGGYTAASISGAGIFNGGSINGTAELGPRPSTSSSSPIASPTISNPAYYIQIPVNTSGLKGIGFKFDVYCYDATSGTDWAYPDFIYSTNGGSTWNQGGYWATTYNTWQTANGTLPAACDDNPNLLIRIYGYWATSASSTVDIDNFQVFSLGTTNNAGTKTLVDFTAIYTGMTSGLTGSLYLYDVFTASGSGTTVNLTKSNLALTGGLHVSNGATFNFGTSSVPTALLAQTGSFTAYPTANIGITSNSGIMANPGIYGNVQTNGTRTYSTQANYNYMGGTTQNTGDGLPLSVNNLTINNGTGVILTNASVQVNGTLNLTNGVFSTGGVSNKVVVANTGTVNRTNGFVYGDLQKPVPTGSNVSVNFETGNLNNYTPFAITFPTVATAGDVTARVNVGNHPNLGNTCLNPSKNVNQYWTVSNGGVSPMNYNASFGYTAAELTGSPNPTNFLAGQYSGGSWTLPTLIGTPTATNTQISGLSSGGDFQVAESNFTVPAVSISSNPVGPVCQGSAVDFTAIPVNGGGAPAYLWKLNGANVGSNSPTYSNSSLVNNDVVNVVITSNDACTTPPGNATATVTANITVCGQSWIGLISSDWNTAGNWSGNAVPTQITDVVISSGTPFQPVITSAASCKSLTINSGAVLTINPGFSLTAHGVTTLNGSQCLVVKTSAAGEGSFIDNGSILGPGSGRFERYVTSTVWHYISSPVPSQTASIFSGQYIKKWLEPSYTWQNITSTSELLSIMRGYALKSNQTKTFNFTGKFNSGLKSFAITRTTSLPAPKQGWNLVGNPYPSYIDWDAVSGWNKTNVNDAVYIYNQSYSNYATYVNGFGVNGGGRYIAPGQGFYVTSKTPGSSTISMDNGVRTHSSAPFLKSSAISDLLRIRVSTGNYSDEIALHFSNDATNGFDSGMDAYKLIDGSISQAWIMQPGDAANKYAIVSMPKEEAATVPIAFAAATANQYTISISGIESFTELGMLYLEDAYNGTMTDVLENPVYSFYAAPGQDVNRFMLHFSLPASVQNAGASFNESISIYPSPNKGHFVVSSLTKIADATTIEVLNVLGEKIYVSEEKEFTAKEIELGDVVPGVYFLKITSDNKPRNLKFVVCR